MRNNKLLQQNILVVGGTGMLLQCSLVLASKGDNVAVLSRHQLEEDISGIQSIKCDYKNEDSLLKAMHAYVKKNGRFDIVVNWSHDSQNSKAPYLFAAFCDNKFYHVLPSAVSNPSQVDLLAKKRQYFEEKFPKIEYHTIILGFKRIFGISRWLTHKEISSGVLDAIYSVDIREHLVGQVRPWDKKP